MLSAIIIFLTLVATLAAGQGVTSAIAPEASPPAGCAASYPGTFEITVAKVEGAVKRDVNAIAVSSTPERTIPFALHLLSVPVVCHLPQTSAPEARKARHSKAQLEADNAEGSWRTSSSTPPALRSSARLFGQHTLSPLTLGGCHGCFQMNATSGFAVSLMIAFLCFVAPPLGARRPSCKLATIAAKGCG